MRVLVAGAGIAGLAVARGLSRVGAEVVVLERDSDLAATGGYKLHLGPAACTALRSVLRPEDMQLLRDVSVVTPSFTLVLRDHRGRRLVRVEEPGGEGESLDVDRITLRLLLAEGLQDRLRLGVACESFTETDSDVTVTLSNGSSLSADVLVIAEGAGSRLAQQLAGSPTSWPTGLVGVAGRTLAARTPARARELLVAAPTLAVGPGGAGLFASWHAPGHTVPPQHAHLVRTRSPVAIWGVIAPAGVFAPDLKQASGTSLADRAAGVLRQRRWAPWLVELVANAEPDSIGGFRFVAADPDRPGSLSTGRVTVIGDAAHAMPPTGGQGAATAIRDAAVLARCLDLSRSTGAQDIRDALARAQIEISTYAWAAVRESLQPVRWIRAAGTPAGALVARGVLPTLAAAAAVKRRLAAHWASS